MLGCTQQAHSRACATCMSYDSRKVPASWTFARRVCVACAGSPFAVRVQRSAAEQLYLMNCVFGVEITTTDSGKKGVRVLSVRCVCTVVCVPVCARACVCGYCGLMGHWRSVGGPANLAGITDEDFIKEIDGVHRTPVGAPLTHPIAQTRTRTGFTHKSARTRAQRLSRSAPSPTASAIGNRSAAHGPLHSAAASECPT